MEKHVGLNALAPNVELADGNLFRLINHAAGRLRGCKSDLLFAADHLPLTKYAN
ncbi:MAG: hypothetical protein LH614_05000 [Pyrinomonadaceae bacterium]|nr:hypothetical protein [Pyrinomonadaceae bacterium]